MAIRTSLPFDEKNEEDFQKVTEAIKDALSVLVDNPKIPATQEKLAELSKVTRKTLYNRKWAIIELKKIKERRKAQKVEQQNLTNKKKKLVIENSDNIKTYRNQNSLQFEIIQEKEEIIKSLERLKSVLEARNESLEKEKKVLETKLRLLNRQLNSSSNVVKFSP